MRAFLLESLELHSRSFTKYFQRLVLANIPTSETSFQTNCDLGRKKMPDVFPGPIVPAPVFVEPANPASAAAETGALGAET